MFLLKLMQITHKHSKQPTVSQGTFSVVQLEAMLWTGNQKIWVSDLHLGHTSLDFFILIDKRSEELCSTLGHVGLT